MPDGYLWLGREDAAQFGGRRIGVVWILYHLGMDAMGKKHKQLRRVRSVFGLYEKGRGQGSGEAF